MNVVSLMAKILAPEPSARRWYVAVVVLISFAAASQLPQLSFDRSDDRLISQHASGWSDYQQAQADFGDEQSLLIYLRAPDLWTEQRLKQLQQLAFELEDEPEVTAVSSLLSATNIRDKGEFVDAGPLATIVPKDPAKLAELRSDAEYSPIMRRNYISGDGLGTAITLSYETKPGDPDWDLAIYRLVESKLAPLRDDFEFAIQLGRPRLTVEIERGLSQDLYRLIPLSVVILVAVMTFFLKSFRLALIPLFTAALAVLWSLGFMAATGIPITLLTAMIPALIMVIGSVEDVHLITSYLEAVKPNLAQGRTIAIQSMARRVGLPILITSLTTIIGFAANVITEIPLIFEFAIASAFAMLASFAATALGVPLLLSWFGPLHSGVSTHDGRPGGLVGAIVRFVEAVGARAPRVVLVLTAVALVYFAHAALGIRVNTDPLSYFPEKHPLVLDANRVHSDLSGLHTFSVVVRAKEEDYFRTPEGLSRLSAAQVLLENQRLYDKTLSLATLLSLMHQEYHGGDRRFNRIADKQDDIDLYLSTMPQDELAPFVTPDFKAARISVRHNIADSVRLNAAVDDILPIIRNVFGDDASVQFTGKNLMVNRAAASLVEGQLVSLALVLGIIFALFSVLYTSWLAGALALVPNFIPIVFNFGAMGWLGVPLNPGTAMVAAIAIGIAVDDTIHLMTRFGAESKSHIDEAEAVRSTVRGEALPIIATSLALALGFLALATSSFSIVAQFGVLAAATMLYAAAADLLLMPILLKRLRLATMWDIIALELDRDLLINCPLFAGMTPFQIKKVVVLSHIENFAPGDVVIEQGTISRGMYVVLRGKGVISIRGEDVSLDIDTVAPGNILGEIGFSGDGVERTATITASEPMTVVRIDADTVRQGLRFYPRIAEQLQRNISNILGWRLAKLHRKLLDLTSH